MSPNHLRDIISSTTRRYASRNTKNIPSVRVNNNYFMDNFFPYTITEYSKLDLIIRSSTNMYMSRYL